MRKLIYGYLNELTMDLNKVVYFGKEDRKNDKFNRFNEHRKEGSKHYNELIKMKYILFSFIPQSLSLSDAEAFYIQEYNPELNIMGNPYNGMTEKLSNEEMKTMRKALKDTKWYLIKNIEYPLSTCNIWNEKAVGDVIKEMEQREKRLRKAAYVFKSKEEIAEMKFSEIIKLYEKGELFIEPRITLTLEEKLLRVIPLENSIGEQWVEIEEDGYPNRVEHIYFKKIELYHINELQYDLEQAKVECINKEKTLLKNK